MKNILVATDGSDIAEKALIETKRIAETMGSNVTIMHVSTKLASNPYLTNREYGIRTDEDLRQSGIKLLDKSKELFEGCSGEIKTVIRSGDASRQILQEVNEGDYDLIVMGNRGFGALSRAMLGSVSYKVLNQVDIKVLIVR